MLSFLLYYRQSTSYSFFQGAVEILGTVMWNVHAFIGPRLDLFWAYHGAWVFAEIFRHNLIVAILVVRCYLAKKVAI